MIEAILSHYGFHVDRRGDLVNAWFRKARAEETDERLDMLGRLMAEIVDACEGGVDTDRNPIRLDLPRAGVSIDTSFLSRLRGRIETTGTVIG